MGRGGEDGGWSGVAAAAAGEAMVTAGRGLCQANRGRDAAGNVVPQKQGQRKWKGQFEAGVTAKKASEAGVTAMKLKRAQPGWRQAKQSRAALTRRKGTERTAKQIAASKA
eukprot:COSAG01_NODE_46913_length_395_cov_1.722973_1_plen_110_part_01